MKIFHLNYNWRWIFMLRHYISYVCIWYSSSSFPRIVVACWKWNGKRESCWFCESTNYKSREFIFGLIEMFSTKNVLHFYDVMGNALIKSSMKLESFAWWNLWPKWIINVRKTMNLNLTTTKTTKTNSVRIAPKTPCPIGDVAMAFHLHISTLDCALQWADISFTWSAFLFHVFARISAHNLNFIKVIRFPLLHKINAWNMYGALRTMPSCAHTDTPSREIQDVKLIFPPSSDKCTWQLN